jgi:hypothetical protein
MTALRTPSWSPRAKTPRTDTVHESEGLRPATLKIPTSLVDTRRAVSPPLHQAGQFLLLSRIRVGTQHKLDSYRNH